MKPLTRHHSLHITKRSAFTLLEMSLVLAIIGVLLGGGLVLATRYLQQSPVRSTTLQMRALDEALWNFRMTNGRMPCPSDITLDVTSNNFGREASDIGTCAVAAGGSNFSSGNGAAGMIPTKSLGLPDEMAFDGWGRRIFYAVDIRYTAERFFAEDNERSITGATQANPVVVTSTGHGFSNGDYVYISTISGMTELNSNTYKVANQATDTFELQTIAGANVNGTGYTAYSLDGIVSRVGTFRMFDLNGTTFSYPLYVTWSAGENGHGAYPRNGGSIRFNAGSTNTDELENCDCGSGTGISGTFDLDFVQREFSRSTSSGTNQFDDIVFFKTRAQMEALY
jgi:prepilin-type N-terminal cleavage/methylation domain-containing protein